MAGGGHPPKRSHPRPTHTQNTRTSPHPKPHPNPKPNTKPSQNKRKIAHGCRISREGVVERKRQQTQPPNKTHSVGGVCACRACLSALSSSCTPTPTRRLANMGNAARRFRRDEGVETPRGGTAGGNQRIFSRAVGVTGGEMREEKSTEEHSVPRPRYLERIDKSLEAMRDSGRRSDVRPRVRRTCYARA